jgi:hypothetical protein
VSSLLDLVEHVLVLLILASCSSGIAYWQQLTGRVVQWKIGNSQVLRSWIRMMVKPIPHVIDREGDSLWLCRFSLGSSSFLLHCIPNCPILSVEPCNNVQVDTQFLMQYLKKNLYFFNLNFSLNIKVFEKPGPCTVDSGRLHHCPPTAWVMHRHHFRPCIWFSPMRSTSYIWAE